MGALLAAAQAVAIQISLEGQRALVTGASSGIGRAIAIALGRAGAGVVINYLSGSDEAQEVVAEVRKRHGDAIAVQGDVSKPDGCKSVFEAARRHFGGLDIVVPNAGFQRDAAFAYPTGASDIPYMV